MIPAFSVPSHSGTGAGAAGSSTPSPTRIPTAAWVMLLAMLHEINVESASSGCSGWKSLAGWTP